MESTDGDTVKFTIKNDNKQGLTVKNITFVENFTIINVIELINVK